MYIKVVIKILLVFLLSGVWILKYLLLNYGVWEVQAPFALGDTAQLARHDVMSYIWRP